MAGGLLYAANADRINAQCQAVELRPGYPMYAGYVTGLVGYGDAACLESLLAGNPGFDPSYEDTENIATGARLGLVGAPEEWTWENWMAVEAERSLLPTCYSCATFGETSRTDIVADWVGADDPRLLIGGYSTTTALGRLAAEYGRLDSLFQFDRHLRAIDGLVYGGHRTSYQVLDGYRQLVTSFTTGNQYLDVRFAWDVMIAQGGYAPVPPTAAWEDQIFMVRVAVEAIANFAGDEFGYDMVQSIERAILGWQSSIIEGDTQSFASYLQDNGFADIYDRPASARQGDGGTVNNS